MLISEDYRGNKLWDQYHYIRTAIDRKAVIEKTLPGYSRKNSRKICKNLHVKSLLCCLCRFSSGWLIVGKTIHWKEMKFLLITMYYEWPHPNHDLVKFLAKFLATFLAKF